MWVALFIMLMLATVYLKSASPAPGRPAEDAFWRSTSWLERKHLKSLVARLPGEAAQFASLDLQQLCAASRHEFIRPTKVATATNGPRDLCLVALPDGSTLRLTVFDDRNAARFVDTWSPDADLAVRLRWVEGLGWQCSLHTDAGARGTIVASVYGWLAAIDRDHIVVEHAG